MTTTLDWPLRGTHRAEAAALRPAGERELPVWYGPDEAEAVAAEYAAARAGAALVDLAERGVLAVTGPQRQKFLQGLLSHDVAGRTAGQGCPAALMDVKGHVLALLRVLVDADGVQLEMPADRLALVEATLQHYRVAAPVRFAAQPVSVLGLVGPRARAVLSSAGASLDELAPEGHVMLTLGGVEARVVCASDLPNDGLVLHVAPADAPAAWRALRAAGAWPLGRRALDALRVEQGRPWYGCDVKADNLLHETGLVRHYHSSTKGCYVGQEVIARLEARGGNVNKDLRGLRLEAPSAPGVPIQNGDAAVGHVTTAAVSPRLGPIAMGYVHRNHFTPGTVLTVGGRPATVTALPLDDGA